MLNRDDKKNMKNWFIFYNKYLLSYIIVHLLLLISCNSNINYKVGGMRTASGSIAESKQRKMYIQSYHMLKNAYNDLNIKEVFVERGWAFGKSSADETIPVGSNYYGSVYQFVVKIEEGMRNIYYLKYALRVVGKEEMNYAKVFNNAVYSPIDSTFIRDTIKVDLVDTKASDFNTWKVIGTVIFVKNNN